MAGVEVVSAPRETAGGRAEWLGAWAAKHGVRFEPKGQCGFGRDCVGMLGPDGGSYVDYEEVGGPSAEAPDAYHKADCLCVLVKGDDSEEETLDGWAEAVQQLYWWVRRLDAERIVPKHVGGHEPPSVSAMFGHQRWLLVKEEA